MRRAILTSMLVLSSVCGADTVIRAMDQSRAPFPGILVVVKYREDGRELGRYLTAADGGIPRIRLEDGLYRLIFTCPYGICKTTIMEVLGKTVLSDLNVEVPIQSTDEHGVVIGQREVKISVQSQDSNPLTNASILIRNLGSQDANDFHSSRSPSSANSEQYRERGKEAGQLDGRSHRASGIGS